MSKPAGQSDATGSEDMQSFLNRSTSFTLLPTPLPPDHNSHLHDLYFIDSVTQDSLAVIDACLHNYYDVPRAKQIFETLRKSPKAEVVLDIRLYNSLLESFIAMATSKDIDNRLIWLEDACTLFNSMETGMEVAVPNATTYAIMFSTWLR
jgi:DNA-directed RNA polymerase